MANSILPKRCFSFLAVFEEIMLIARRIRTEIDILHPFREHVEGFLEYPELFVSRGDIPIPELRVKDKPCFRPKDVERLIGFISLVGEEGVFFLRFYERGVHVQGGFLFRTAFLDGGDEVPVYLHESLEMLIRRRDEGFAFFSFLLFLRVVEGCKEPEYGGRGRDGRVMLFSPSSLLRSPLLAGKPLRFDPADDLAEALVLLEDLYVVDGVSAGKVEQDEGENHLFVRPALDTLTWRCFEMISQAEDGGEVEVDGKARKGRHVARCLLFFVLVGKSALCHN